jgi:phosphomannomutase
MSRDYKKPEPRGRTGTMLLGIFIGLVLGLVAARFVGAQTVVTPVTSNSALEAVGFFETVERTRVGSPFVIAGMERAGTAGQARRKVR